MAKNHIFKYRLEASQFHASVNFSPICLPICVMDSYTEDCSIPRNPPFCLKCEVSSNLIDRIPENNIKGIRVANTSRGNFTVSRICCPSSSPACTLEHLERTGNRATRNTVITRISLGPDPSKKGPPQPLGRVLPQRHRNHPTSGGVSKSGRILELYHDSNSTQSFYQTSCREGVKGHPCRYIDRSTKSMCVQRYTYTYALVREFNSDEPWRLDYIRVRSGCSCEVKLFYGHRRKDVI
ncbi:hypothetical protein CEXT_236261 [Caerostris extrusa]|uniref:Nerve growth factor-related domain-containing protein n=1 Tax=Caerostris extrusa TaxID=172846 RepID=A0AAV4VZG0_CAEEX|nr:hypothetical protein CEXT_236261 [Caerostris extrusa]